MVEKSFQLVDAEPLLRRTVVTGDASCTTTTTMTIASTTSTTSTVVPVAFPLSTMAAGRRPVILVAVVVRQVLVQLVAVVAVKGYCRSYANSRTGADADSAPHHAVVFSTHSIVAATERPEVPARRPTRLGLPAAGHPLGVILIGAMVVVISGDAATAITTATVVVVVVVTVV
jgi:hypothetical protein